MVSLTLLRSFSTVFAAVFPNNRSVGDVENVLWQLRQTKSATRNVIYGLLPLVMGAEPRKAAPNANSRGCIAIDDGGAKM
jgi:hypothetical protein